MKGIRLAREFMRRYKWRVTLALAITLLLVLGLYAVVSASRQKEIQGASVAIYMDSYLKGHVDAQEIQKYEAMDVLYDEKNYRAIPLAKVLQDFDAMPTLFEMVVCIDEGGNQIKFSGADLADPSRVYLAFVDKPDLHQRESFIVFQIDPDGSENGLKNIKTVQVQLQE